MRDSLKQRVRQRANNLCEYCHVPQELDVVGFEIEHIVVKQHGGRTVLDNLALSCMLCNRHKGPNLSGIDPETSTLTRLFNPRQDHWEKHFEWIGPLLHGRTVLGRATIAVLAVNQPNRVAQREILIASEEFP